MNKEREIRLNDLGKKPRLLLINPWIYDFTAYDFWSKPLGLLYIASVLRHNGYHVEYIDCMDRYDSDLLNLQNRILPKKDREGTGPFYKTKVAKPEILKHIPRQFSRYGITEEIFRNKIKKIAKPKAVLVTSIMSYWYPGVFKVIELVKKYYPGCPVILGGIYATLCYQHALTFSGADFVLRNSRLDQLLGLLDSICGLKEKQIFLAEELEHIHHYLYPAWDLYPKLDYICLITTKGCPFRCSYCASGLINPKLEFRNYFHVVNEINYWGKKGVQNFIFYDDALLVNAKLHFIPLMEELRKRNLKISFHTPNAMHAGFIDATIAQLMAENGFKNIWLGFETSDTLLQNKTGGKIDNVGFKESVSFLLKAGFSNKQIRAYILVGLPGQSLKSIKDSVYFVMDTGIKPYLAKFSPIPGTQIWDQAIKEYGFQEPVDPLLHNDALMPYHSPLIDPVKYQDIKNLIQSFKL